MNNFKCIYLYFALAVISAPFVLYSQDQKNGGNEYYKDLSDALLVKPYLAYTAADYSIYYNNANGKPEKIKYNTLEKEVKGIALSWKDFGISAGVGRVTAPEYQDDKSKNKLSYDFRINYLGRKVGYDLYYLKQDGLFLRNKWKNPDGTLPYYSSMDYTILSANIYYIFSWESFSLRAAYDSLDRQKKSSGSFLLMMSSGIIRVSDDTSMLREDYNSVEEKIKGLKKCRTEYVSISPGYSKTFVFYDNFFFNLLFFCGIGADQTVYTVDSGKHSEKEFFLRANSKFALGYSGDKFFCGASLNLDIQKISMERGVSTSTGFYDSKFYAGYRFFI